jgi:biopolymer transport protein TolR
MAMTMGSGKSIVSDMNVTPMIDVLLVLIIVFMVINTASVSTGLEALAPKPPVNSDAPQPRTVVIQLAEAQGGRPTLKINQEPVTWEGLRARLIDVYKTRAERVLFVKADSDVEFDEVARVIDTAHGAFGDMRVGLLH